MRPILFEIFGIPIYAYGTCIMLGFLFAILLACRHAQKDGIDPNHVLDLGIVCVIFGILGARLFFVMQFWYKFPGTGRFFNIFDGNLAPVGILLGLIAGAVIFHGRKYAGLFKILHNHRWYTIAIGVAVLLFFALLGGRLLWIYENPDHLSPEKYNMDIFKIWSGGLVYYGGLIGASGFVALFLWLRSRSSGEFKIWHMADIVAPFLALGLAFGRVGCFLNGCCWGKVAPKCYCAFPFPGTEVGYQGKAAHAWSQHTGGYARSTQTGKTIQTGCRTKIESRGAIPLLYPESLYLPETAHQLSKAEKDLLSKTSFAERSFDYSLMEKLDPEKNGYDPWFKPLSKKARWSYRVLPTQPLSFLFAVWLWIFLMGFYKRRRHNGETILLFGAMYSIIRFTVEFCRGDVPRGYLFGLTISQTVSVFTFAACGAVFIYIFFFSKFPRAQLSHEPFVIDEKKLEKEEAVKKKKKKPKKKKKKTKEEQPE